MDQNTARLVDALMLAQRALNAAPRFAFANTDSYRVASIVDAALNAVRDAAFVSTTEGTARGGATNALRCGWAETALTRFMRDTGVDYEDSLGDLLADLMHWARHHHFDFDAALARADGHFRMEQIEGH